MAYTPYVFEPGVTKFTSAWANKIESHMERLGRFLGVFETKDDLPTALDYDWAIAEGNIWVYVGSWQALLQIPWENISNIPQLYAPPNTYYPKDTYAYWFNSIKDVVHGIRPIGGDNAFFEDGIIHDVDNNLYVKTAVNVAPFQAWQFQFPSPDGKFQVELPYNTVHTFAFWIRFTKDIGYMIYLEGDTSYALKIDTDSNQYVIKFEEYEDGSLVKEASDMFPDIFFNWWHFVVFEFDYYVGSAQMYISGHLVYEGTLEQNQVPSKVYFSGKPSEPHPWIIATPMIIQSDLPWTEDEMKDIVARAKYFL